MSARNAGEELVVGGRPRADLMPPEIISAHRAKTLRRRMLLGLLGTVVAVALATAGATVLNVTSQISLMAAQTRTAELLAEQAKYADVRRVQDEILLVEAGQKVGASTEIDWKGFFDDVEAKLPDEVAVTTAAVDSSTPLDEFAQSEVPLQGIRVSTVGLTAVSPTLPDVSSWLDGIAELPGYVSATPESVSLDEELGVYTAIIVVQLDHGAWSERYTPDELKVAGDAASSGGGEE